MTNQSLLTIAVSSALAVSAALAQTPGQPSADMNTQEQTRTQSGSSSMGTQPSAAQTGSPQTGTAQSTPSGTQAEGAQTGSSSAGDASKPTRSDVQQQPRRTAESGASSAQRSAGQSAAVPVVMMLVPVQMQQQSDQSLANGCWAKLYGQQNLQGDSLTLVGPVEMRNMTGPFGVEWGQKTRSIQAGPRATVTIYDNEDFRDPATTVQSGKQVNDISKKMGLFEEVDSMRITCSQAKG